MRFKQVKNKISIVITLLILAIGSIRSPNFKFPLPSELNVEYDGSFTFGKNNINGLSYSGGDNPLTYRQGSGATRIVDTKYGHQSVLESDMSTGIIYKEEVILDEAYHTNCDPSPITGVQTVEWWWAFDALTTTSPTVWLYTDTDSNLADDTGVVYIWWQTAQFFCQVKNYDSGEMSWYQTPGGAGIDRDDTISADEFYHFRISLDYDLNEITWSINGKLGWESETWSASNLATQLGNITKIAFGAGFSYTSKHWMDSLSWSWDDDYSLGDLVNPEDPNPPVTLEWEEYIGNSANQEAHGMWANETHVYTAGWTGSTTDAYITKSDADGNLIWTRTWGGSSWEKVFDVVGDDEYIYVCGETISYSPNSYSDNLLMKWDANGNLIWYKTWGTTYEDKVFQMVLNGLSIYLIGNNKTTSSTTTMDLVLLKYDTDGNRIWGRNFVGPLRDSGHGITIHGDYIYAGGITYSYGAGNSDLFFTKWDGNGNLIWYRTWGGPAEEWVYRAWADDNYVYTTGRTASFGAGGLDMFLVKWDHDGNQIWNRTFGGSGDDVVNSLVGDQTGLYISGYVTSYGLGINAYIAKWSFDGNIIWNQTWGGSGTDFIYASRILDDTLYTAGYTTSYGSGGEDCLILKWKLPPGIEAPVLSTISPNPDIDGIVNLDWNDVLNADNYTIYRDTSFISNLDGGVTTLGTSAISSFTDTISVENTYYYVVIATNESGDSYISNCESVVVDLPDPDAPTLFMIGPNPDENGQIYLDWNDVEYADNYTIFRHTSFIDVLNGTITNLGISITSSMIDFGLSEDTYYYVVIATNETGDSEISNCESVVVEIPGPDAPVLNPITPYLNTDGTVHLDWDSVPYADLYNVLRHSSLITENNGTVTDLGSGPSSSFTDYSLFEGTYYYALIASNETGLSAISNCESVVVNLPGPHAPELETVTPNPNIDGEILLDWNFVPYADNYTIYRYNSFITELNGSIYNLGVTTSSSFMDLGLAEGTYYYIVIATNATGNSIISNCESVVVDLPEPDTPELEVIVPNPDLDGFILLNWNDVVEADFYRVYRDTTPIVDITGMIYIAETTQSNYVDAGLENGVYYYVLIAIGPGGESELSNNQEIIVEIPVERNIPGYNVWIVISAIGLGSLILLLKLKRSKRFRLKS